MSFIEDRRSFLLSLGVHFAIVLLFVVRPYFSTPISSFKRTVKVDVVALPQKNQKIVKPLVQQEETKKEKVKTKEANKTAVLTNKKKPNKEKSKNKEASEKKQKPKESSKKSEDIADLESQALSKLKKLKEAKAVEQEVAEPQEQKPIAGNRVSKGESLVGVEKTEYRNYKEILHNAISADWELPKWLLEASLQTIVEIKIDPEGNVIYKSIVKSSGNQIYDEKVMGAIKSASPFQAPPEKFKDIVLYEGVTLSFP